MPASLPLQEICWKVMEAVSRAAGWVGTAEHPLGLISIDVDAAGCFSSACDAHGDWPLDGQHPRAGAPITSVIEARDRRFFAQALERARGGEHQFLTIRMLCDGGTPHVVHAALRAVGAGRIRMIVQPLIVSAPVMGRHANPRDPTIGLFTRWSMSGLLEEFERDGDLSDDSTTMVCIDR